MLNMKDLYNLTIIKNQTESYKFSFKSANSGNTAVVYLPYKEENTMSLALALEKEGWAMAARVPALDEATNYPEYIQVFLTKGLESLCFDLDLREATNEV